jgi:hypothetical protein
VTNGFMPKEIDSIRFDSIHSSSSSALLSRVLPRGVVPHGPMTASTQAVTLRTLLSLFTQL